MEGKKGRKGRSETDGGRVRGRAPKESYIFSDVHTYLNTLSAIYHV